MTIRTVATFTAGALLASALTFTGMQSWQAGAAPGDDDTTFVPVAPCRLFDTRPGDDNVGPRSTPIGQTETFTTQVTGSNGECVGVPNDATAVAFNVTTVNPTNDSFLTLFPADLITPPLASNLNWVAGQPPTPNKVDVKLSPDGKVSLYNNTGTVDVVADIVGYYTPSSLTEITARLDALEAATDAERLDALEATVDVPSINASTFVGEDNTLPTGGDFVRVQSVTYSFNADARFVFVVSASLTAVEFEAGADVQCHIARDGEYDEDERDMRWEASGDNGSSVGEGDAGNISGTRTFDVSGTNQANFALYCAVFDDTDGAQVWSPTLSITRSRGAPPAEQS